MRRQHRPDDQDDDQPQVEPVEPAAALAARGARSGPAGSAPRRGERGTSRRCRAPRRSGGASRSATARRSVRRRDQRRPWRTGATMAPMQTAGAGRGRRRCLRFRVRPSGCGYRSALERLLAPRTRVPARSRGRPPSSLAGRRARSWASAHRKTTPCGASAMTAMAGSDRIVGPMPSQSADRRVVRVERVRQDHVHVQEDRRAPGRRRRRASARRDRRQDAPAAKNG